MFGILVFLVIMIAIRLLGNAGIMKQSTIDFISLVLIYSIVGLGFSLLLGYTGLASLGTAGFIGMGTYVISFGFASAGFFFIALILALSILADCGWIHLFKN